MSEAINETGTYIYDFIVYLDDFEARFIMAVNAPNPDFAYEQVKTKLQTRIDKEQRAAHKEICQKALSKLSWEHPHFIEPNIALMFMKWDVVDPLQPHLRGPHTF